MARKWLLFAEKTVRLPRRRARQSTRPSGGVTGGAAQAPLTCSQIPAAASKLPRPRQNNRVTIVFAPSMQPSGEKETLEAARISPVGDGQKSIKDLTKPCNPAPRPRGFVNLDPTSRVPWSSTEQRRNWGRFAAVPACCSVCQGPIGGDKHPPRCQAHRPPPGNRPRRAGVALWCAPNVTVHRHCRGAGYVPKPWYIRAPDNARKGVQPLNFQPRPDRRQRRPSWPQLVAHPSLAKPCAPSTSSTPGPT